jgi:hypothetical protein
MPAPIIVSVRTDFAKLEAQLTDIEKKQLPFARSQAANRLSKLAVTDLVTEMERVFNRPTRWVLKGIYARLGTKKDPHGEIIVKDQGGKGTGTPAANILSAEIMGGQRKLKRFERALGYRVEDVTFIVPGKGAVLDQYGNIPKGQIQKILSALGAAETSAGYTANRNLGHTRHHGRGNRDVFFVATSKRDGRPLAIYQVIGSGKVAPIFFFPRAKPRYEPRFAFYALVRRSVDKHAIPIFREEIGKAFATAH